MEKNNQVSSTVCMCRITEQGISSEVEVVQLSMVTDWEKNGWVAIPQPILDDPSNNALIQWVKERRAAFMEPAPPALLPAACTERSRTVPTERIQINNSFKNLIPPLTDTELTQLEENILLDGIRESLIVWNSFIIDGHNRYYVAQKHKLPFTVKEMNFTNENEAQIWIIRNQLGRRNLSLVDRNNLAVELREKYVVQAKANQVAGGRMKGLADLPKAVNSRKEAAAEAGVKETTLRKHIYLSEKRPDLLHEVRQEKRTYDGAFKLAKQAEKNAERTEKYAELGKIEIPYPNGEYRCIVIDPPWQYDRLPEGSLFSTVDTPYPSMTVDEIRDIPVASHADCIMFLWATQKFLVSAIDLLKHWGFNYKSYIMWDKEKMGMGLFIRFQTEVCLVGMKGNIQSLLNKTTDIRDVIRECGREHSRKPEQFYDIVDKIVPYKKLEYFSRTQREGWETWGNDVNKFENLKNK